MLFLKFCWLMESSFSLVVTSPLKQPNVNSCANSEPSTCIIKSFIIFITYFSPISLSSLGGQVGGEEKGESFSIGFCGGHKGLSLSIYFGLLLLCLPIVQGLKS